MQTEQEKRRFVRLNALTDVVYKKVPDSEGDKLSVTKNISKGGICLIAYEDIKKDDILDLNIYLPEQKEPVSVIGKVAWVSEFVVGDAPRNRRLDVGVEFINIKDEDAKKIEQYVFKLL